MRRWLSWGFLVVTFLIHILYISSLWTGSINSFFHDTRFTVGQGADFFSYYQAGHNVLNGLNPYTNTDPLVVPYMYPYRYLPYFAFSFGVLVNLVSPTTAYWIWTAIVTMSVWLAVLRTRWLAKTLNRPDWESHLAMGLWFVFSPIYIELYMGQVTLVAGILLFFALTTPSLVTGGKSVKGSMTLFWTTGALTKLIPYFTAPVLLGAGRVRAMIAAFIVTVIAIIIVPSGLESLQFFLSFNAARSNYINPYVGSHSLKMLILYLIRQSTSDFTAITGLLIGIFGMLSFFALLYSRDVWSCAGLFSLTYFFIMADVWEHHYTFILPFLVLAWIRGRPEDKARWIPFALALIMSLPIMPMIEILSGYGTSVPPITWEFVWQIVYHSSKVVPTLIFFIWLFLTALRSPRGSNVFEMVSQTFRMIWTDLTVGKNPIVEAGILVRQNMGNVTDHSI